MSKHIHSVYLSVEVLALFGGVVLGVGGNVATTDFLDGDVLDVEADVVTGEGLGKRLVVHLHGFDLETRIETNYSSEIYENKKKHWK